MTGTRLSETQRKVLVYLAGAERASVYAIAEHALGRPRTNYGRVSIANVEPSLYSLVARGLVRHATGRLWESRGQWLITDAGRKAASDG